MRLPADLPEKLRDAGLKVVVIDGWQNRGRPASTGGFAPVGVLNHHTGSVDRLGDLADDRKYALWLAITGRPDLPAPLVQLSLSLEGTVYVLAAGRCNHAGTAKASGSVAGGDGNSLYVGIEWMLSGTQAIPPKMYEAGVALNAVLLDVLGSSVQAVSCHYQTSVTGKWDIGDPHGVEFNGHKVLNVGRFRDEVKKYRAALHPPKVVDVDVLTISHTSLQFGDTKRQHTEDIEKILARGRMLVGGTEAGLGSNNTPRELQRIGTAYGYTMWVPQAEGVNTDCWVGVHRDLGHGKVKTHYDPVIPSSIEFEKNGQKCDRRWGPKGLVWVEFDSDLGHISHGEAHYLTGARHPGAVHGEVDHWKWNEKLGEHIGGWAVRQGAGSDLAFVGLDSNMADSKNDEPQGDMFFGTPLTTAADELSHWENTGHGPIDGIASYDHDGRVKALDWRVYTDRELQLETDHYHTEADYQVRRLR